MFRSIASKKIIKSKAKCPKCGSEDLYLTEVWQGHSIMWEQIGGEFDLNDGSLEPGDPAWVEGRCKKCKHAWRLRGIYQIIFVEKD